MKQVNFTPEKRDRLKHAMEGAVKRCDDKFTFDGDVYLVSYAKYVLEYLDNVFKMKEQHGKNSHR